MFSFLFAQLSTDVRIISFFSLTFPRFFAKIFQATINAKKLFFVYIFRRRRRYADVEMPLSTDRQKIIAKREKAAGQKTGSLFDRETEEKGSMVEIMAISCCLLPRLVMGVKCHCSVWTSYAQKKFANLQISRVQGCPFPTVKTSSYATFFPS